MLHRRAHSTAVAIALAAAATASASDLYWQGGTDLLGNANYFEPVSATSNSAPTDGDDALYIGASGTATHSTGDLSVSRIIVGHAGNSTSSAPGAFPGAGTVEITGGNVTASSSIGGGADSGLIVGLADSGSLSITNATLTVENSAIVGYLATTTPAITASVAINAGGTLTINNGGIQIGANGTSAIAGAGGSVTVNGGTFNINGSGNDLVIGVWNTSSFTQTSGATTVADETFVGRRNADFTTFTMSGGTFNTRIFNVSDTTGNGRIDDVSVNITGGTVGVTNGINIATGNARRTNVTVGGTAAVSSGTLTIGGTGSANANVTFTGNSTLTGSGGLNIGNDTSNNTNITFSGNTVVNLNNGLTAGLGSSTNTSITVADNATLNLAQSGASNVHLFIGRGTSNNTTLTMTGGNVNVPNYVLIGTATAGSTGTTLITHSGGTLTAGTNLTPTGPDPITVRVGFKIGDTAGNHTYNLSGTGVINVANGALIVGRQGGTSVMNQSGGTVTANGGVHVGDAETATASFQTATGTYNISAGTLTASLTGASPASYFTTALSIAHAGNGTFRVIGDDATININGDVLVNALPAEDPTPARVGTLAFQLETGDASLSTIAATGTATFAAGSILQLDFNAIKPTQGLFTLLTAADIIDNGLTFNAPGGWTRQIVPSTGGKTLRVFAGDLNADLRINADDFALMDRNFALGLTGGANGDFNADGTINSEDYLLIDTAYAQLGAPLSPGFLAAREAQFGPEYVASLVAAVPEPASLGLLVAASVATLSRRRKHQSR